MSLYPLIKVDIDFKVFPFIIYFGPIIFELTTYFHTNSVIEDISMKVCPKGQAYVTCGKECAKTCSNLHLPCSKKTCEDGCVCPQGQVFDNGKCIYPDECPCHRGGKSYKKGETYHQDCNTW